MSEGEALIIKKNPPKFALAIKWQTTAANSFFQLPSSTRIKRMPLFWILRRGIRKGRQPKLQKGYSLRKNRK